MSSTLFETTVTFTDSSTEKITHGWSREPKDGVLHLYDVEGTDSSRTIVLANVLFYDTRRLR